MKIKPTDSTVEIDVPCNDPATERLWNLAYAKICQRLDRVPKTLAEWNLVTLEYGSLHNKPHGSMSETIAAIHEVCPDKTEPKPGGG